jgi:aspartate/methionine/tyrosine aminotransferase
MTRLANRLNFLGGETAFAVSLAAAAWAAKGHKVYSFHLGDINIPTAPNIMEAANKALHDGKTGYVPAAGIMPLRELLAADVGARRGLSYTAENVAVQPGGKPVIGKFIQAIMNPGDEVLYPSPGYPIYESMIDYHGGVAKPYRYVETGKGFALDLDYLKAQITPKTRVLIFNNCQNPLAAESDRGEIEAVAQLAMEHDLQVLADDAYEQMRYSGKTEYIVNVPGMSERTVTLYTFSKKYAMTGWRLGAAIGPKAVIEAIAQLNVNDESCTANFVQWAGVEALNGDQSYCGQILHTLRQRRDAAVRILSHIRGVTVVQPESTFYLFPNVTQVMQRLGYSDVNEFATAALHNSNVSFCTRKHFGRIQPGETQHYVRFAYSGIDVENIEEGLARLKAWIER